MKLSNKEEISKLIADEPFYSSCDSFCLGKNLTEAGEIIRDILSDKEKKDDGMLGVAVTGKQKDSPLFV